MKSKRIMQCCIAAVLVCALVLGGLWAFRFWKADQLQQQMLTELDGGSNYDPQTIVLQDTTKAKATELAERLGAGMRITEDGSYAALYLPEGVTIRDIVAEDDNREILSQLSIDYHVQVSELEEEEEEPGLRLPARPDYAVSDDAYSWQGYLDYLNMKDTWNSCTGSGVTVAVIDTGIDTDHPEFAGRISEYSYNATEDKIVKDYGMDWSLIEDEQGHGTAVTGVLAAAMDGTGMVGIAPNVEIIVIKAECDESGNFKRTSDLVFGLYYAIERDVQVVNMSFGGVADWNAAIQLAYDSDIICVAAAGNDSTAMPQYPAAHPLVIGVGALESDSWELADYSNYGENVDIVAPGTTYTTAMGGGYGNRTGTSLSAPQVAGAVALFMQTNPYTTFDAVTEVLYASGYDLGALGRDWYYGFGALDLSAFLLEERGTVTFEMLTDELENQEGLFIRNHTMQELPEPERLYAVFDGWYYDDMFTEEYNYYSDVFTGDLTLYAKWVNEDDGIPYTYVELPDGTIEIRSYTGKRRFITVPEKIEGKVVSSIGDFAFSGQTRLREVTLPSGLTNIGLSAFEGCSNLVTMQIPAKVTKIGEYAFADNVRLHTVGFSGSKLTNIGAFAFKNCGSLEQIELPSGVKTVDGSAFFGTTSMKRIQVQNGNGNFASTDGVLFSKDGSNLVAYPAGRAGEYTIPGSCTAVGNYAFAFADIRTVDLKAVKTIGKAAFAHSSLETLTIPDGVTSVGTAAFSGNAVLSEVTIGNGLTGISEEMFSLCGALQSINIPAGIQSIEDAAFWLSGMQSVTFASGSKLEMIGDSAFAECSIGSVVIPDSVTGIGDAAFLRNPLTAVAISANSKLKTIGMEAFRYCRNLTAISLPGKLESIDELAFADTGLETVNVPRSVTTLGRGAFAYCPSLTAVAVEAGNSVYHDIGGVVYTLDNTLIHTYPAGKADTSYTLEAVTTSVGSYAFAGTSRLDTVYLSEVLVDINEYGFDSTGIDYITIPDSMIRLGRYSFTNCLDLGSVTFHDTSNLARIGFGTFVNCGLTGFTVPANVSTMGQYVFLDCDELTSITFAADSKLESLSAYIFSDCQNLRSITFEPGSALTSVQAHGLEGMENLTSIDFGDAKVTNIDNFAFRFCTSLSAVDLPETVTNVGRYAFYGCESLSELALPVSVEHIGSYAFLGTTDLQLYLAADHVPAYLDEDWDRGIAGYYVGVTDVETSGDYKYAKLTSGGIAILEYTGDATTVDLTQVDLGGSITAIGGKAFLDTGVTSVILPDTLTEIQAQAFAYSKLTAVAIPANVTFIGREAFIGTPVASLTFSGSKVKTIEQRAFAETENLKSVTIPKSVTTLGTGVFQDSGLTSVKFASGIQLTEIPQKAFMGTKLESVALPDSVTKVNHNAFNGVSTLKSVSFGNASEIKLMSNAFYRAGLTSLHIPANVTYIGEFCFVGLENLTSLTVDAANPNYKSEDGLLLSKNGRKLIAVPAGRTGSLTVPTSVEEIGFGAFERSALTEVKFDANANILTFGCRAFFEMENLKSISVPASVVSIDYYAFAYCDGLETVTFAGGNNLKGIYEGAFCGDRSLTDITVPNTIVEISDFAFYGCESLDRLPVENTDALKGIYDYAFAYTGISGDFTTPENLIDIGNYAFMGIKAQKITVPDTKQKELIIGIGAFEGCNELKEITLPFIGASFEDEEITWFGYVFGAGSFEASVRYVPVSLKTVTITDGITFIGYGGFGNCSGLNAINLPEGITELGDYSFAETSARYELKSPITACWQLVNGKMENAAYFAHFGKGLTGSLVMGDGIQINIGMLFSQCANLQSVDLPDGMTSIPVSMFSGCVSLREVSIPNSVTVIEDSAFSDCNRLTEILLPAGLTRIESNAFSKTPLTSLELPSALTYIGDYAFDGCQIYEIINHSELPLTPGTYYEYGNVAYEARLIIDAQGNSNYRDGVTSLEFVDTEDGFRFAKADDTYTLLTYIGKEDTARLPLSVNGCDYTLGGVCGVSTLIIPGEMKVIPEIAFAGSTVTNYILEEGIEEILDSAFSSNRNLKSVVLPNSLRIIGQSAFDNCQVLERIIIPDSVESIGPYAFNCCYVLNNLVLPSGLTVLEEGIFQWCFALERITIPESVDRIGTRAFSRCESLEEVAMPSGLVAIGQNAFAECITLKQIEIPSSVTDIGNGAFPGNAELILPPDTENFRYIDGILYDRALTQILHVGDTIPADVILPDTITIIPDYAFQNNSTIRSIVIPEGVAVLGDGVFQGSALSSITLPENLITLGGAFEDCENLTDITLPDGLIHISGDAFRNCGSLQRITIPDTVSYIGPYAFFRCEALTEIRLPDALTELGMDAFSDCTNLRRIVLPMNLSVIEESAFFGCKQLKFIENNSTLELEFGSTDHGAVAQYALVIAEASGEKRYRNSNVDYEIIDTEDGFRFVRENGAYMLTAYLGDQDTIVLPDSINGSDYTLWYFNGGKNIVIPDGWTSIGENAFRRNCTMETVSIPESVTSVGECAFFQCSALKQIHIPDSVESIGNDALRCCSNLTTVVLPKNLKEISQALLAECIRLTSILIPDTVTVIGDGAFSGCVKLETVNLPEGITELGSNVFYGCTSLTELDIPEGVRCIYGSLILDSGIYQDPQRWNNGMLILDGWLLHVNEDVSYISCMDEITNVAHGAYAGSYSLKNPILGSENLQLSNMSVVVIPENSGAHGILWPAVTLESVVLLEGASLDLLIETPYCFSQLSDVIIFVEEEEQDLRLDDNFPGWNNGNRVVYGGDWIWANFYDEDGTLLLSEPKRTSEVIRRPVVTLEDDRYHYVFTGWDLDGDGSPDSVPATSAENINAVAVYEKNTRTYTVTFRDGETGEIYSQQSLPYGAEIVAPADPVKNGQIFEGWSGYAEGMTVTGDMEFTARWHTHSYTAVVTEPTCTEEGFTTYTCDCGDSYVDGVIPALGHDFAAGTCTRCGEDDPDHQEPVVNPFGDVPSGQWYEAPVLWAVEKGITSGTGNGNFSPNQTCTRAQVVTFLWRAVGQPEPVSTDNPFTDVKESDYFFKAVLWAREAGVTAGRTATTFDPNAPCTRDQVVTFLWRALGKPAPQKQENPFTDVASGIYYYEPVLWAVENGITSGTSATTFAPSNPCTRAQVVTFLYRALKDK